jgi:cytidylate kinase
MTAQQRRIGLQGRVVMVGRDIGTVVMPEAPIKIYLEASVEERARRRWQEYHRGGGQTSYEEILASMRRRDAIDGGREIAPMRPAPDATTIDTTDLSMDEVTEQVMALVEGLVQEGCHGQRESDG